VQLGRASTAQVAPPTEPAPSAEALFCHALRVLRIERVLDLGGSCAFAAALRRRGFRGTLFSVEPRIAPYRRLLAGAQADPLWFALARQGAGAAASFRQLGGERVFINQSSRLLRADVMQRIEALRIDAREQPGEVIEGYLPLLEHIRLILVDDSASEEFDASRTGGRPFDLRPLEARGFAPLPADAADAALAGGQGRSGHAGSQVLCRAADGAPEGVRSPLGLSVAAIVTSIGGPLERRLPDGTDLGPLWLQSCLQSWQRIGAPLVSVAERPPPPGIRWERTASRPSLAQMLGAIPMAPGTHLLLTNADIVLTEALAEQLGHLPPDAFYYGSRLDVKRSADGGGGLTPLGLYELGFDFFLLPAAFVRGVLEDDLLPAQLRIGEPWWDYLLPLLALARGFPVKKLGGRVLAMHYKHPTRYADELWVQNRAHFIRVASRLLGEADGHATAVLTELLAHLDQIPHLVCRALP